MATFQDWLVNAVAPGFLRRKWGKLFMTTIGYTLDLLFDDAKSAVKARFPGICPDDALGFVGGMRNTERYRAEDTDGYRAAVVDAWNQWYYAGTSGDLTVGLVNKLYRLGYTATIIGWPAAHLLTPGPPTPYEDWWSAFWVVIYPSPFVRRKWGDPGLKWGQIAASPVGNPDAVITWGSTANSLDVLELRRALRKWRPAHEISAHVIFKPSSDADVFDPGNIFIGAV